MPKKTSITKKDLQVIKDVLLKRRAEIVEEFKGNTLNKSFKDSSGDLSGYSFHMADMATDLYDREFLLSLAEGERDLLYELDQAIKRIDEGNYGKCEVCGCVISKQRLKALPHATSCIKCKEEEEKEKTAGK